MNVQVKSKLKEYCKSRKISLQELSKMTGLSAAALYKRENYTADTIGKILAALECRFEDIYEIIEIDVK